MFVLLYAKKKEAIFHILHRCHSRADMCVRKVLCVTPSVLSKRLSSSSAVFVKSGVSVLLCSASATVFQTTVFLCVCALLPLCVYVKCQRWSVCLQVACV